MILIASPLDEISQAVAPSFESRIASTEYPVPSAVSTGGGGVKTI